jgi:hypothetical protein
MSGKKKPEQEEVKLPKLPHEYDYRGGELLTITADEFRTLKEAIDTALASAIETKFISAPEWISTLTGVPYKETPPEADVKSGVAKQVTSTEKTFSAENYIETYEAWVYPKVITASDVFAKVHSRMIQAGIATPISVLKAEYEAAEALRLAQQKPGLEGEIPEPKNPPKGDKKPKK